jgi:uncharacterized protein
MKKEEQVEPSQVCRSGEHRCPQCDKATAWRENPHRPFCSERCKMKDLGHWAAGDYCVPGESVVRSVDDEDS